jgi:hypothetical protein
MKVEYKDKITGEIKEVECTEVGCKNIGSCEDGCIGFVPIEEEMLGKHGEPIKDYPDYDDDSDLFNHHKKEPWGYVR